MKKSSRVLILLLLAGTFFPSCENSSVHRQQESGIILFGFALPEESAEPQRAAASRPDAAAVIVTISDDNTGEIVENRIPLALLDTGGDPVSRNLRLAAGRYRLEEFFVVDDANRSLFIAPKCNSPAAIHVDRPLPVAFDANTGSISRIISEVIALDGDTPADFGYAGLEIPIITPGTCGWDDKVRFRRSLFIDPFSE